MDDIKYFVEFTKKDEDKRQVSGYASTEALDSQNEVVEKDAIARALPGYLGEFDQKTGKYRYGNLREMHQLSAVGKTIKANMDNRGLYIEGKVVDDNAWKKVKEGVYAGFSIGGKIVKQVGNRIKDLKLSEISLVDRPANPEAVFLMVKADKAGTMQDIQREEMTDHPRPMKPDPHTAIGEAGHILELAQELRMIRFMLEMDGRSTIELDRALTALKTLASKILTGENAKKFDHIMYGISAEEMESLVKAKLTTQQRKKIPGGQFAYIDSKGGKHLPIQDKAHAQNAMARWNQTHFESSEKKRSAARRIIAAARRFGIEVDPKSSIAQAAKKAEEISDIGKYIDTNWTAGYFGEMKKIMG